MNWIQRLFKSKKVEQPMNSALNKHNVIKSVCEHKMGYISPDFDYYKCECGEVFKIGEKTVL
jgi:hypothetical protein